MNRLLTTLLIFCALTLLVHRSASAVTMAWTMVGNPGNAADPADGDSTAPGIQHFGAVNYSFRIATYDVTNSQYVEFLNAKDSDGANARGLYSANMSQGVGGISFFADTAMGSKYAVIAGRDNWPVVEVSRNDAARFANWLNNGQGTGDTETGTYSFFGGELARNPNATIFLPSEDEWYKAAYYDPSSVSYFLYPTSSNDPPIASVPSELPNHANFLGAAGGLTDVGAYTGTTSPYGAFDMGGNVYQWNEALISGTSFRRYPGTRGGGWPNRLDQISSNFRGRAAGNEYSFIGFRVASTVPEPSTLALAAFGVVGLLVAARRRRCRR